MHHRLIPLLRQCRPMPVWVIISLGMALLWSYWPMLREMSRRWTNDPQYSHGYLVPAFALVMLWLRREQLASVSLGLRWGALVFFFLGGLLRFASAFLYFDWFDAISLLPCLAGMAYLLGGAKGLRWASPAIVFLFFMIPLPFRLEHILAFPLQRVATIASTYALQTIGFPALAEGNVILLDEVRIGVVEACSGLSMMVIFFALSTAVAFLVQRPLWEKGLIVLSAIPISLIANITRITVTGFLHETTSTELANLVFHDLAGWLMMPYALGLLGIELKILSRLLVEPAHLTTEDLSPIHGAGKPDIPVSPDKQPRQPKDQFKVPPLAGSSRTKR